MINQQKHKMKEKFHQRWFTAHEIYIQKAIRQVVNMFSTLCLFVCIYNLYCMVFQLVIRGTCIKLQ